MELRTQLQDHLGDAFRIERELGGGGMSRVFMAIEVRLNRRVAIKVLSPELAQGLNAERFEREILLSASLQQANIVPVLAAGDVAGLPYFTMPFVEGESLRSRLTGTGLPVDDVVTILRDVSKALAYAHARGIVHRDVKPDNVLLSGGTAVVTDFGIAKAISAAQGGADRPELARDPSGTALTQVGTSIGTPPYMAPEQIAGDPNIDHSVDLYALGCMAFEMLTGRTPFGDLAPQRILAAHLSELPAAIETLRPDCPPTLALLVARLLEKDPADRVPSAAEVVQVLGMVGTASSESDVLSPSGRMVRSLVGWAVATMVVWIVAKAAVVGIGLPDWTVRGAVGVMLLGLPVLLATGWAKWMARRASTATPTLTPGGSHAPLASGTMTNIAIKANRHLSFRRAQRGGMYAMAAFVLLIAAFMITRSMGIGPAASLFASGTLTSQDKIVLADFVTDVRDTAMAPIVQEAVRAAMSQSNAIRVVSPTEVAVALGEMQRPNDTPLDASVAQEVAERTNAKAILGGRLVPAGQGFLVSLELKSANQGVMLASFQGTADGPTALLGVIDDLTRKLRSKVGESLKNVANTVPLERATTTSLEALRLFSEASRDNDVTGDFDRSVTLLRQALALDSTFALAWRKLSSAAFNARAPQSVSDSALEMAARYADKLPPIERELVIASLHDLHSTLVDRRQSSDAYRAVLQLDSTNTVALNNLAMNSSVGGEYDSAFALMKTQYRLEPNLFNHLKLALSRSLRHPEEAQAILDSIARATPGDTASAAFRTFAAMIALSRGDLPRVATLSEQLTHSALAPDRVNGWHIGGLGALTAGQPSAAAALGARAESLQTERGQRNVLYGVWGAMTNIAVGLNLTESIATLDRIVASPTWNALAPADRPYLMVARLYARASEPAKGAAMLQRLRAEWPTAAASRGLAPALALAEGEVALAAGRTAEAITKFRAAALDPDGGMALDQPAAFAGLARAFSAQQQFDSATVYLERYLAIPATRRVNVQSSGGDAMDLAAVHKRLGELYDDAGERTKAIAQYQAFVDQWKNAEPELQPTVASVRARLRELQTQEGR